MKKEQLTARIELLEKAVQEAISNYNSLVGRLQEAKEMLPMFTEAVTEVAEVVEGIVE